MKLKAVIMTAAMLAAVAALEAKSPRVAPSYAWGVESPLGFHRQATIDTLLSGYYRQAIPSAMSRAYATTGNISAPGLNMVFMERQAGASDFFPRDALDSWIPSLSTQRFYNTRIPMTLLSYNFGGGRENGQNRLQAVFSGNAGPRWQAGAMLNYVHSKGSYAYQAAKDLTWGASASYMGDRFQMQAFIYHYNNLAMDNGGITDDLYITDPAELQGGKTTIDPKTIPTRLETARSRIRGTQLWVNNRYMIGHRVIEQPADTVAATPSTDADTVAPATPPASRFVPVVSFIHTLDYRESKYRFDLSSTRENADYWAHTYFDPAGTHDLTTYWSVKNTLGVDMIEGFHRLARFGLAAYATYEVRRYNQIPYTFSTQPLAEGLDAFPYASAIPESVTHNRVFIGGRLAKTRGSILTYGARAEIGVVGGCAGDVDLSGHIKTRIPLRRDSVVLTAAASLTNKAVPYLLKNFVSNHFVWHNDFTRERRLRISGTLEIPRTATTARFATETLLGYVYFGPDCLPRQEGSAIQVMSATVSQPLAWRALHWDNTITWQTSTSRSALPLPQLVIYSNLYLSVKIARVLSLEAGIDCDYYTRYRGVGYQPATMSFYCPDDKEVGGYPFCNLYFNMKLSKARFYLLWSHFNQGLFGGSRYFSMPGYPLNPRRFQLGVSVDFAN